MYVSGIRNTVTSVTVTPPHSTHAFANLSTCQNVLSKRLRTHKFLVKFIPKYLTSGFAEWYICNVDNELKTKLNY